MSFQSSSILNWFIKHRERIKSFSIFASVVYIKRFTTKGKQTLSHFLEKLLITKAIYQLNKYNKAWLNTNLAKTPTLFTVEFQELLEIFYLHTLASILFACKNVAFYTKQDFSRALSFPHHTLFVF